MVKNYKRNRKTTKLKINTDNTTFLIMLFLINSIPFAQITLAGKSKNSISEPFLLGINSAKNNDIVKFNKSNNQLFLNELFTESVFGDFIIIETTESIIIKIIIQLKLFLEYKRKLLKLLK